MKLQTVLEAINFRRDDGNVNLLSLFGDDEFRPEGGLGTRGDAAEVPRLADVGDGVGRGGGGIFGTARCAAVGYRSWMAVDGDGDGGEMEAVRRRRRRARGRGRGLQVVGIILVFLRFVR